MPVASAPIVVVADDDDDARSLLVASVREAGCIAYEANNGGALIACVRLVLARGDRITLVVSDINMPEEDGIDATKHLLELDEELSIVLMSAFASASVVRSALEAGAKTVLRKPFATAAVLDLVAQHRA